MVLTAANGRLRQERLKRGWSEQALADRIQQWEYEHGDRHDLPVALGRRHGKPTHRAGKHTKTPLSWRLGDTTP